MTINTGGPAFPCDSKRYEAEGMTLRDYFAAKAMQGLYANPDYTDQTATVCAQWAYELADAMLAAREAGKPEKQADDGWIEWKGGKRPVHEDAIVEIKTRYFGKDSGRASQFRWEDMRGASDIIAYRVVQP